jgi:hypothetical protein
VEWAPGFPFQGRFMKRQAQAVFKFEILVTLGRELKAVVLLSIQVWESD